MSVESKARVHVTSNEIRRVIERRTQQASVDPPEESAKTPAETDVPQTPVDPDFGTFPALYDIGGSWEVPTAQEVTELPSDEKGRNLFHGAGNRGTTGTPPKNPRGPLTQEEKEQAAMLISYGHSLRGAAAQIGRSHMTLSRYLRKDKDFAAQVERYRGYAESDAMTEIVKASRNSWRAAAWLLQYLERRERKGESVAAGSADDNGESAA